MFLMKKKMEIEIRNEIRLHIGLYLDIMISLIVPRFLLSQVGVWRGEGHISVAKD